MKQLNSFCLYGEIWTEFLPSALGLGPALAILSHLKNDSVVGRSVTLPLKQVNKNFFKEKAIFAIVKEFIISVLVSVDFSHSSCDFSGSCRVSSICLLNILAISLSLFKSVFREITLCGFTMQVTYICGL